MHLLSLLSVSLAALGASASKSHPRRENGVHHFEERAALKGYNGTLPTNPMMVYDLSGNLPPDASKLQGFNMFALAFWRTDGTHGSAATWEAQSQSAQKKILAAYRKKGVKLLVSAFGDAETPVTSGKDPKTVAKNLAAWVKKNNLDGVDIDFEDFDSCWKQTCAPWVITFQTQLRTSLGVGYIITHAPIAPWFATSAQFGGGYLSVYKSVGASIDLFAIQFYNQGTDYSTCNKLIVGGGSDESVYAGTALMEIAKSIPKAKLLIGKPATSADAGSGYTDLKTLKTCVQLAEKKGWKSGLMVWSWANAQNVNFIKSVWP